MKKMFDHSAKNLVTSEDHIGVASGVENDFPNIVKTVELSPEWAKEKVRNLRGRSNQRGVKRRARRRNHATRKQSDELSGRTLFFSFSQSSTSNTARVHSPRSSQGADYFQEKYKERKKFFDIARNNRIKKGMDYQDSDQWLDRMVELIAEMRDTEKKEL